MLLKNKTKIEEWLKKYEIQDYELIEDKEYGYVVNVNERVHLSNKNLKSIDVKFNIVDGNFNCDYNELKSLLGCPEQVNGFFDCSNNKLISLESSPKIINGDFSCLNNQLEKLIGCPEKIEGYFDCRYNNLKSLEYIPKIIEGYFQCSYNKLTSLIGCPEIVNDSFDCSNNELESLNGCPKVVNGDFFCSSNKLTINGLLSLFKNDKFVDLKMNYIHLIENKELNNLQFVDNYEELKRYLIIIKQKNDLINHIKITDLSVEKIIKI